MTEAMDAAAVADAVAAVTTAVTAAEPPPLHPEQAPPQLPPGWILKESLSNPGYYYYYNMETGVSTWDLPTMMTTTATSMLLVDQQNVQETLDALQQQSAPLTSELPVVPMQEDLPDPAAAATLPPATKKREANSSTTTSSNTDTAEQQQPKEKKRRKTAAADPPPSSTTPAEVRVLHILKKHVGSRRPSSWRNPKITATKEAAHEELQGLLEVLQEEVGNPRELRATFEELARTESDCSSAKRGGDLGYFGRKKMQPAFEEASFALKKGELTQTIVDTSSGSHIILRIG